MLKPNSIIRAFEYKNYRLFWGGQAISLIGTWMQRVAMGWLVYRLTDSPFMLGMVDFIGQMPAFLLAPVAGVYLDRWDRRRILIITQILLMVQALVLAALVLGGWVHISHVIVLSIIFGLITAFDQPARQTFLKDIVKKREDIGNAIALNSTMFNGARLIGPSIAGITIALVGEGWCFFINGFTFIAIIVALWHIQVTPSVLPAADQSGMVASVNEGMRYAYRIFPIRIILMVLTMVSLVGLPYTVLLPILARDVFHGDASTLGFLTAFSGIGALYGAYYLARRKVVLGLERVMLVAVLSAGAAFLLIGSFKMLYPALFFVIFVGFGFMVVFAAGNTILQTLVADDKRGRVLSLYTMTFQGMAPIGSLLAGSITKVTSAPFTLCISGILLLCGAVVYSRYLKRMRFYIRRHQKLLPESAN